MANKEMKGFLFPNGNKTEEKHPDFKGNILVNNKKIWVAGWKHSNSENKEWISLSLTEDKPKEK